MNPKGSCNCGEITFEVNGSVKNVVNCHCNLCRRMYGGAFSTYVIVNEKEFNLKSGSDKLKHHKVSQNTTKFFCGNCGSPIYNIKPQFAGLNILHLGALNNTANYPAQVNIFCDTKLNWVDSISKINSFEQAIS